MSALIASHLLMMLHDPRSVLFFIERADLFFQIFHIFTDWKRPLMNIYIKTGLCKIFPQIRYKKE